MTGWLKRGFNVQLYNYLSFIYWIFKDDGLLTVGVIFSCIIISVLFTGSLKKGVLCTVVQLSKFSLARCLKKGVLCTAVQVFTTV